MRIINAIIHKLEKEPRSTDAEYRKGHPIQTNSGALTRFAEALQTAKNQRRRAHSMTMKTFIGFRST